MSDSLSNNTATPKYFVGTVIHGDERGAKIGFPTANLELYKQFKKPANGVYACLAQVLPDKTIFKSVLHVGPRPTFKGSKSTIEAHLLDYPYQELYGGEIKIFSLHLIRSIKRFTSVEELTLAIIQDINQAHQLLSNKI